MSKNAISRSLAERLESLTELTRDKDYKQSDKKQAERIGIPYQTFRKYLNDNAECSISNLDRIAKFYDVSADYLLGRTDLKSLDDNDKYVFKHTGLTDGALTTIQQAKNEQEKDGLPTLDALNELLDNDDFAGLIEDFAQIKNLPAPLNLSEEQLITFENDKCRLELSIIRRFEKLRRSMIEQLRSVDYE